MSTKLDQGERSKRTKAQESALIAVSGGVDSITILHLLCQRSTSSKLLKEFLEENKLDRLEVAYIDHSQRDDTNLDVKAIQALTDKYSIKFHIRKLDLPAKCSEQTARDARYKALEEIRLSRGLEHIITAHHADDAVETAIINLTRGTGPRGLSSLRHQPNGIWRPFLFSLPRGVFITKKDVLEYAKDHNLAWHEDSTNNSDDFLRNRVRSKLSSAKAGDKLRLLNIISANSSVVEEIDRLTNTLDHVLQSEANRETYRTELFRSLPEEVKNQFLHSKLSQYGYDVSKDAVARAKEFIENKTTGKILQLKGCNILIPKKGTFTFSSLL